MRQRVLLDTIIKGNDIVDDKGNPIDITETYENEERGSEGNRMMKLAESDTRHYR